MYGSNFPVSCSLRCKDGACDPTEEEADHQQQQQQESLDAAKDSNLVPEYLDSVIIYSDGR